MGIVTEQAAPHLLVILPTAQDRKELAALEADGFRFAFIEAPDWRSHGPALESFDALAFSDACLAAAADPSLTGVFCSDDFGNLIQARVCEARGWVGPSVDAMVLSNHKLYSRMSERDPIRFEAHRPDSPAWDAISHFPVHLKLPCLSFSLLQSTARSREEVRAAVATLGTACPNWERPYRDLFKAYCGPERFPLAQQDMVIAEEFVEGASVTQHAVEGWTDAEGGNFLWAVSDNNYYRNGLTGLDNNSVPTRLEPETAAKLVEVAFDVIGRSGLTAGFWNVELWVHPDGRIQVTEVNGRVCASMTALYRTVFGMSQYPAALRLAAGIPIDPKVHAPTGVFAVGGMFAITSTRGGRVSELLDLEAFAAVGEMPGVVRTALIYPKDTEVTWSQAGGCCCLARTWIVGPTFEEIEAKADAIRRLVLR
jgi:hypothetical protein